MGKQSGSRTRPYAYRDVGGRAMQEQLPSSDEASEQRRESVGGIGGAKGLGEEEDRRSPRGQNTAPGRIGGWYERSARPDNTPLYARSWDAFLQQGLVWFGRRSTQEPDALVAPVRICASGFRGPP